MKLLNVTSILLAFSGSLAREFQPWQGTYQVVPLSSNDALCCLPASSVVLSNTQTSGKIVDSIEGNWESSAGCKAIGIAGDHFTFSTVDEDTYAFAFPDSGKLYITAFRNSEDASAISLGAMMDNGITNCFADLHEDN